VVSLNEIECYYLVIIIRLETSTFYNCQNNEVDVSLLNYEVGRQKLIELWHRKKNKNEKNKEKQNNPFKIFSFMR
jgi:hypothetical protein